MDTRTMMVLLAAALAMLLVPVFFTESDASDPGAEINGKGYASVADALSASRSGDIVYALPDSE
ncbi:MAG: hypothetical protein J5494_03125, partial [Candidatus Methanomethylophilaceae archaeon]|nr:hypothetical protein [Candidatus Methanomethylophilaceae archaeon]